MVTVVLTQEGKVFYTGFGSSYQLVEDENVQDALSIAVTDECYYVLQKDGKLVISHQLSALGASETELASETVFPQIPAQIGGNYGLSYALL